MAFTTTSKTSSVFGNQRALMIKGTVNIVGDTLDVSSTMHSVKFVSVEAGGSNAIGHTLSSSTITFAGTTGAVNVLVLGT